MPCVTAAGGSVPVSVAGHPIFWGEASYKSFFARTAIPTMETVAGVAGKSVAGGTKRGTVFCAGI